MAAGAGPESQRGEGVSYSPETPLFNGGVQQILDKWSACSTVCRSFCVKVIFGYFPWGWQKIGLGDVWYHSLGFVKFINQLVLLPELPFCTEVQLMEFSFSTPFPVLWLYSLHFLGSLQWQEQHYIKWGSKPQFPLMYLLDFIEWATLAITQLDKPGLLL